MSSLLLPARSSLANLNTLLHHILWYLPMQLNSQNIFCYFTSLWISMSLVTHMLYCCSRHSITKYQMWIEHVEFFLSKQCCCQISRQVYFLRCFDAINFYCIWSYHIHHTHMCVFPWCVLSCIFWPHIYVVVPYI